MTGGPEAPGAREALRRPGRWDSASPRPALKAKNRAALTIPAQFQLKIAGRTKIS
jgi:hypothetical protein